MTLLIFKFDFVATDQYLASRLLTRSSDTNNLTFPVFVPISVLAYELVNFTVAFYVNIAWVFLLDMLYCELDR